MSMCSRNPGGDVHRLLARHRIDHEQHLVGLGCITDRGQFGHERLVDLKAACRVDHHDVATRAPCLLQRALCQARRAGGSVGVNGNVDRRTQGHQLLDGGRTLPVGGNEHGVLAPALETLGQLCGRRRLP